MIGAGVQQGLRQEGYAVDWVRSGSEALTALATKPDAESLFYDLMLLDLGLPGKDGLAVLADLRSKGNAIPVLILTARDAVPDRIRGLDTGADDYMVKPFDLDELAARIRALLRRHAGRPNPIMRQGSLVVDPASRSVTLDGQPIRLSAKEYMLLSALMSTQGKPLSRPQLEERIYGWGEEIESNAVEVYIHSLRRKIGTGRILNLRGVGWYMPNEA